LAKILQPPTPFQDGVDVAGLIRSTYGSNVIEFYGSYYDRIKSCGQKNAPDGKQCFYFWLEPTDGDRDHNTDRARIEVRLAKDGKGSTKAGEANNFQWYFYVQSDVEITNEFFHIHQVKSDPPTEAAQPPIITYTLEHGKFSVKHIDSRGKTTTLQEVPASNIVGKWILANESIKAGSDGWFETHISDASTNALILTVPRIPRDMWRDGVEIHPKFGVYRHHGNWHTTHVAFSEWKITKI